MTRSAARLTLGDVEQLHGRFGSRDDEAILWTVASRELTNRQTIISAEPPSQSEDDPERVKQMEVRIR